MITLRTAAQQALEALEMSRRFVYADNRPQCDDSIAALRAALAQRDEPVEPVDAHTTTLRNLLECCLSWEPDACVLGNVTARQAVAALRAALAQQDEPVQEPVQEQAEPIAWLQPKTMDAHLRPDLGYETCSSADYGAFPVYRAPPKAEPAQKPAAVVGTQVDVWRGWDVRWAPPGGPIKTALMLKDMPVGTMLYTTPPKRQPLTEEEIKDCFHDARNAKLGASKDNSKHRLSVVEIARAIEQAHGIIEPRIEEDSHQTLDEALQQPRAMAQAYEAGYKAGQASEREACERACKHQPHWVACVAAIRARGNT